jgi:antitoxin ParD1/3/4
VIQTIRAKRRLFMATLNVSLSEAMCHWVDEQVQDGEYADVSDYISDLIRRDQQSREALRLALIEAEQSGVSSRTVMDIMADEKKKLVDE